MKVALTNRVIMHYRVPVLRRLARMPNLVLRAFHGGDFPGTQTVNAGDLTGFDHVELATIRLTRRSDGVEMGLPLCPTLPWHLVRFRPDVILAEGNSNLLNNFLVFAYAMLTRTPVVFWTLGELHRKTALTTSQRLMRSVTRWMEGHSSALLGYSSRALEYFDWQGLPKERQFRAVNCVDTNAVFARIEKARPHVAALRRSLQLDDKQVLLYVGAITAAKRLEDLVSVYARLKKDLPQLALLIVGDGPHRIAVEQLVSELALNDVTFAGQVVHDVSRYFLLGDVFVLPWLGGLAISEAMAHGLPVVATEADGCEVDLIEQGENGYILPVGDQDAMEDCLRSILKSPERVKQMGERSGWIIKHRHNIDTYMENVVRALEYAVGHDAE